MTTIHARVSTHTETTLRKNRFCHNCATHRWTLFILGLMVQILNMQQV
jgi:hypothetical protein